MNQYAIDGLKVKLAEINAAGRAAEQRVKALAADKAVIMEALRIMGAETGEGAVSLGIASGAFTRTILEVIRDSDRPMCVREIAHVLVQRAGKLLDRRETNLVVARVRNAMARLSDQLNGELRERTTFWRIKV